MYQGNPRKFKRNLRWALTVAVRRAVTQPWFERLAKLHNYGKLTTQDSLNAARVYTVDDTSTKDEPAVAVGLGCTLNPHLSLEARSVLASYRALSYNTLELAVVLSY